MAGQSSRQLIDRRHAGSARLDIDREEFERVLSDQNGLTPLQELTQQAVNAFGVTGTPSFFINGELTTGGMSFEEISRLIDAKLSN
ncbi:DsbA family protein [Pseudaminobacter sp. NGMCC 1.201702]|uniref:DsbA family protein n=1 Tax=Pseudaminobacter sp. NGMCC 1.201702 TaxID=3391825 RepID=UPI0039EEC529